MGRSQESFHKKEVRNKKELKRKEKEAKKLARKEAGKSGADDMIAYVDENGMLMDTPPDPTQKKEAKLEDSVISTPKQEKVDVTDGVRTGTVSFFDHSKGFGFIVDSETQESVFVHINNTHEELDEGNKVSFEVEMGPKGPMAVEVKVVR